MNELHADGHVAAVSLMTAANRGKVIVTPSCEWVWHGPWGRWVPIPLD